MKFALASLKKYSNFNNFHNSVINYFQQATTRDELIKAILVLSECEWDSTIYKSLFIQKILESKEGNKYENELRAIGKTTLIRTSQLRKLATLGDVLSSEINKDNFKVSRVFELPSKTIHYSISGKVDTTKYIQFAIKSLKYEEKLSHKSIHDAWCREFGSIRDNLDIIKPSDWWAFSRPKWRKDASFDGSIPGEIYANCLYYYCDDNAVIADPMAGSGMIKRVIDDKSFWIKDRNVNWKLYCYDKYPVKDFIQYHDATDRLPVYADFIFLDPPYYFQSSKLYNGVLSEFEDYSDYIKHLEKIISAMYSSLNGQGRLAIISPKWSGQKGRRNIDIPYDIRKYSTGIGLEWIDKSYISRGKQQSSRGAYFNTRAKKERNPISDTCELLIFQK